MNILCTGGTGSIGTAIVRHLLQHWDGGAVGLDPARPKASSIRVLGRDDTKHQLYPIKDARLRHLIGECATLRGCASPV